MAHHGNTTEGSGGGCRVGAGTDPVRSRRSSSWPRWRRHGRGCRQTWAPPSGASPTCSWPWRSCAPATRATPRGEAAGSGGVLALGRAQQDCTPAGEAAFWLSVFRNKSLRTDKGSHEKVSPLKSSHVAQLKRSRKDGESPDHTAAPCSLQGWCAREAQRCPLPLAAVQNQPWFVPSPSWAQQGPWVSPGCGVHAAGALLLHLSIRKPGFVQPQKLGGLEESMQLGTLGGRIY